ncbi:MAG TPA: hypothetical protein VNO55_15780 [Polyangia bacterium]|nr:hypothetical protein [Polyangia bacterium]
MPISGKNDEWALYADHRAHFTAALLAAAPEQQGRLCLLGAGRCNDVDLSRLLERFSEIHLVDISASALGEAVARAPATARARLHCHAPLDLSGMSTRLTTWKKKPPTFAEVEALAAATVTAITRRLPGPFDVVASACVLTQMSFQLTETLGNAHLMMGPIRQSLLVAHLRTLLELTGAGGKSLLVSDLTSSNVYPLDALPPGRALGQVMDDVVERNAFYLIANPTLIRRLLRREPSLRDRATEPELIEPWLWTGAFDRTYLVYGFKLSLV